MIKLKRIDIAFVIAMLAFELSLFTTLALFHFTTAVVVSLIILGITWHYAYRWLNYCFPKRTNKPCI